MNPFRLFLQFAESVRTEVVNRFDADMEYSLDEPGIIVLWLKLVSEECRDPARRMWGFAGIVVVEASLNATVALVYAGAKGQHPYSLSRSLNSVLTSISSLADEFDASQQLENQQGDRALSTVTPDTARLLGKSETNKASPPAKRRTGRPKKAEKDSATRVVAALNVHHGYQNGVVANYDPATNRRLAAVVNARLRPGDRGLSDNALTRFLSDRLDGGYKEYEAACRTGRIGTFLALWNRELPSRLARLRSHESGRENDD
jgi:hypothetical protein